MSHWTSGLPKLDIQPFDPTPLYQAVEENNLERQENLARRRSRLVPALIAIGCALAAAVAMVGLALFG